MHLDYLFTFNLYNVFIFLELLMQIRNFHIPLVSFAAVLQSEVCLPAKIIPVSSVNLCKLCSSTQASVQVTDVDQCGFHTGYQKLWNSLYLCMSYRNEEEKR